jgi:hypothetical protein
VMALRRVFPLIPPPVRDGYGRHLATTSWLSRKVDECRPGSVVNASARGSG